MIETLDGVEPGQSGKIVSYTGRSRLRMRLMEMGFIKGAKLEVKRVAPLGDPIEIRIKGYSISLRKEEARNIEIEII